MVKIADDKGKEFEITGSRIKLTIWDKGQVDGDRISIMLNGKYLLENYSTVAAPKIIETLLSGNELDTIKIIALNEGTLPPNTAAIIIETPFEKYQILTEAKTNEVRWIYLRKKIWEIIYEFVIGPPRPLTNFYKLTSRSRRTPNFSSTPCIISSLSVIYLLTSRITIVIHRVQEPAFRGSPHHPF